LLASCGGGPNTDAVAACKGVHLALAAYHRSLAAPTRALAAADVADAVHQLALVQHDAAMANSADGSYNALMTLLQESQELPFANVAPALGAACSAVTSPTGYL
jgi:hypothetical protein